MSNNNRDFAEQKFNQGVVKLLAGDTDTALRFFAWAIKECPDVHYYYLKRSECFLVMGDYVRALSDALDAFKLDPDSFDVKTRISECFSYLGKEAMGKLRAKEIDECLEILEDMLKTSPDNENYNLIKIRCLIVKNRHIEADILHEQIFNNQIDFNYFEAFKLYYNGRLEESEKILDQLLAGATTKCDAAVDVKENIDNIMKLVTRGKV